MEIVIFLIVFGSLLCLLGLFNLYKTFSRRNWPETIGKIHKNETIDIPTIPTFDDSNLISKHTARPVGEPSNKQELWLTYIYVVGKYKYIGKKLYSAPIFKPTNRISGLHQGDKVKVFYNPKQPKNSFLAHSYAWPSCVVLIIGFLLVLRGAYMHLGV